MVPEPTHQVEEAEPRHGRELAYGAAAPRAGATVPWLVLAPPARGALVRPLPVLAAPRERCRPRSAGLRTPVLSPPGLAPLTQLSPLVVNRGPSAHGHQRCRVIASITKPTLEKRCRMHYPTKQYLTVATLTDLKNLSVSR